MPADKSNSYAPADVLLTHSYHLAHDAKQLRKMLPYPPLGTLYAATALRAADISVAVFDSMFVEPISGFEDALKRHRPRIVVIYEDDFNFVTKMCLTHMRTLAMELAAIATEAGAIVVAHGSDATDHPREYLDHGVDYVLNGEAEQTVTDLCTSLLWYGSPGAIPGLVYKPSSHGRLSANMPAPRNASWAGLPRVARDLIDMEPYRQAWQKKHGYFSTNVVSSRGCPYGCNWCAKPISGNRFQLRRAEQVAAEIHELKTAYGVEHVWFGDDVFALDRHWVEEFATAIALYGSPVPFKIQSRADLMTESTVAALGRAGCAEVWMGVESGSQKILNAMNKGLSLSAVYSARQRLAKAGIRACFFVQFGYPGEGWAEICETIQMIRNTRPDDIGVSVSYPLPGTVFYERVQAQLGRKRNWADSDDLCPIHTASYTDGFYHALRDALHAEVAGREVPGGPSWQRVLALEPVCRNKAVLSLGPEACETHAAGMMIPLAQITQARRV